jgi:hypothetical protein
VLELALVLLPPPRSLFDLTLARLSTIQKYMPGLTTLAEEVQLLAFGGLAGDPQSLCALSRVNRSIHRVSLAVLYRDVNIGAVHVLLARPELARFARVATTIWDEYIHRNRQGGGMVPVPRTYGVDRPIELTEQQAEIYGVDDRARGALLLYVGMPTPGCFPNAAILSAALPARTALLLRLCRHLRHVRASWSNNLVFLGGPRAFALDERSMEVALMPCVTRLEMATGDRLPMNMVLRVSALAWLMMLPCLQSISAVNVLDVDEGDAALLASLRGRSPVQHLTITNSDFYRMACLYQLVQVPRAMVKFTYQHSTHTAECLDLHALVNALVHSPSRHCLQHIDMVLKRAYHPQFGEVQGDVCALGELPALRSLRAHARILFASAVDEQTLEQCLRRLPQVRHLRVVALPTVLSPGTTTQSGIPSLVRRILESHAGLSLRMLELATPQQYTTEDIAELQEVGRQYGTRVVVK